MNVARLFRALLVVTIYLFSTNLQPANSSPSGLKAVRSDPHAELTSSLQGILIQVPNSQPGIAVLLKHKDKTLFKSVRGMANKTDLVTERTGFRLGSVSKPFTALAIMQLVEKQQIGLSDAVTDHIQELSDDWQNITIKDLLTHRVSLPKDLFGDDFLDIANKATNRKLIEFVSNKSNKPLLLDSGSARYCNSCYVLLAEVVSSVSQVTFADYMNKRFFEPFLMRNSYILDNPSAFKRTTALNYAKSRSFLNIEQFNTGAMGQVSSLNDLGKFVKLLKSHAIVNSETLANMTKGHVELDGGLYGLGWMVGGLQRPFFAHGGDQDGYQSELYLNPELDVELIMLSNGGASSRSVQGKIIREVLRYFRDITDSER